MYVQAVLATGSGRDINRHKYTEKEAEAALEQPVVKALLDLCKFRNNHQAFLGQVCRLLFHACPSCLALHACLGFCMPALPLPCLALSMPCPVHALPCPCPVPTFVP